MVVSLWPLPSWEQRHPSPTELSPREVEVGNFSSTSVSPLSLESLWKLFCWNTVRLAVFQFWRQSCKGGVSGDGVEDQPFSIQPSPDDPHGFLLESQLELTAQLQVLSALRKWGPEQLNRRHKLLPKSGVPFLRKAVGWGDYNPCLLH